MLAPTRGSRRTSAATTIGNVAPISTVGSSSRTSAIAKRQSAAGQKAMPASSERLSSGSCSSIQGTASAYTPIAISSKP